MIIYRRLFPFLKPYLSRLALATLCMMGLVVFSIMSVGLVMPFVDTLFKPMAGDDHQIESPVMIPEAATPVLGNLKQMLSATIDDFMRQYDRVDLLEVLCLLIVGSFLLKNIFGLGQSYHMAAVEQGIMRDLRVALYTHLHCLSLSYFTEERKGNIISRLTNDVRIINDSVMAVINSVFRDPPQIVSYAVVLFLFNWKLTILVSLLLPLTGFVIGRIGNALKRASMSSQERMAEITSILDETLSGIRIVKAFGMEKFEIEKFKRETRRFQEVMLRIIRRRNLGAPISEMFGVLAVAIILWFMGKGILKGESDMTPGGFLFYMTMIYQLMQPLKMFTQVFNSYQEGIAAGERVFTVLDERPRIVNREHARKIHNFKDRIEYQNVGFRYDTGRTVLHHVSFSIQRGQIVALVGPSGSGKSTLVDLLPRFYDVTEGAINIDGTDIRDLDVESLRSLIGVVTQETILFNDTVRSNIAYGQPDIFQDLLVEAAKAANAHDFIAKLPQGYDTTIGDRGVKLSGGERQRLSLARAILKNPPILILDEATSALDTESELLVQDAIERLMRGRTSIVIAHRLSTVQHADAIVVIEDGRVRETGRHAVLLQDEGSLYKRLYDLQFRL